MTIRLEEKKSNSGKTVFSVSGEATIYSAIELRDFLAGLLGTSGDLEIDLSGIEKIDTAGFQLFHLLTREAGSVGRVVTFFNLSEEAKRIFALFCEDHQ